MLKAVIVVVSLLGACQSSSLNSAVAHEAKYWHLLGLDELKERHYDTAISHFEHALKADPTYAMPHRMLGIAYGLVGNFAKANEHYKRYLEIFADAPDANQVRDILAAPMPVASR